MIKVHKWVVTVATAISFVSSSAYALELGRITWQSSFGQPLRAKIELSDLNGLSASGINVSLASAADFKKAGIDRIGFLSDLTFNPVINQDGQTGYIQVTSKTPVNEPYVDFLINAKWNSSTVSKEYTILMDITSDVVGSKPNTVKEAVAAPTVKQNQSKLPVANNTSLSSSSTQYKVARGDSLWSIAEKFRGSASANQAAMAIFQKNPKAFLGQNANQLLAGYTLQIPADTEMKSITVANSVAFIHETKGVAKNTVTTDATAPKTATKPLSVSDPKEDTKVKELQTGVNETVDKIGAAADEGKKLEESITSIQAELKRLKEIEEAKANQINTLKEQLKNEEDKNNNTTVANDSVDTATTGTKTDTDNNSVEPNTETSKVPDNNPQSEAPAAEQPVKKRPVIIDSEPLQPVTEESWIDTIFNSVDGIIDMIIENIIYIGGAVLALILGVGMLKVRRRRADTKGAVEVDLSHVSLDDDDLENKMPAVNDKSNYSENSPLANLPDELNTLDKADIYLAYGRFDEAKSLLDTALKDDPMNTDYRLKLMEVYGEKKDKEKFIAEYEELVLIDPLAKERIDELKEKYNDLLGNETSDSHSNRRVDESDFLTSDTSVNDSSMGGFNTQPGQLDSSVFNFDTTPATDVDNTTQEFSFSSEDFDTDSLHEHQMTDDTQERSRKKPSASDSSSFYDEQKDKDFQLETIDSDAPAMVPIFAGGDSEESLMSSSQDSPVFDFTAEEPQEEPEIQEYKFDLGFESGDTKDADELTRTNNDLDWPFQGGNSDMLSESSAIDYEELDNIILDKDQITTKLELIQAYIDMGDSEGAHDLIDEVLREGNESQKIKARQLQDSIDGKLVEESVDIATLDKMPDNNGAFGDLGFDLPSGNEVSTKLALAKAYISMGDKDAARDMLDEISKEGDEEQKKIAQELLSNLD